MTLEDLRPLWATGTQGQIRIVWKFDVGCCARVYHSLEEVDDILQVNPGREYSITGLSLCWKVTLERVPAYVARLAERMPPWGFEWKEDELTVHWMFGRAL